jgi:hypothetical protein
MLGRKFANSIPSPTATIVGVEGLIGPMLKERKVRAAGLDILARAALGLSTFDDGVVVYNVPTVGRTANGAAWLTIRSCVGCMSAFHHGVLHASVSYSTMLGGKFASLTTA